jgi:putative redox protein
MAKTELSWVEGRLFIGTDSHGTSLLIGRGDNPEHPWNGAKPSDLLLLAVASCSAYDVVEILLKQREPMIGLRVVTTAENLVDPPYSFTWIHNHYIVEGPVKPDRLDRAIRLSEEKYCCVINSLRPGVSFSADFEITEPRVAT